MEAARPHLLVGIDFGMTCTGVSYLNRSVGAKTVKWIQRWPGRESANENKVPTVVVYPVNSPIPSSWGFQSECNAERADENKEYNDWFKIYLDPARLAKRQQTCPEDCPRSMQEVEKWYRDYLSALYKHIQFKLANELANVSWQEAIAEFLFSVPTTWSPNPTVEMFRSIVRDAGFGSERNHRVVIGLTEAEAAAVHTSIENAALFKENDILLICDAGGGTTDLSLLQVVDVKNSILSLKQLDVVLGDTIGSAAIDADFQTLAENRLRQAPPHSDIHRNANDLAWNMMKHEDFQNIKCALGQPGDAPTFSVPITELPQSYSDPLLGIYRREMTFNTLELHELFDKQIEKMFKLIDHQLDKLQLLEKMRKIPVGAQVAYLILSGGLGNSVYVQDRLRQRYERGASAFPSTRNMSVRVAPDPQLAVCKGLVADRQHRLETTKGIIDWRCCRASYGVTCWQVYDKKNPQHIGRKTFRDPVDAKTYVTDSVAWLIKKGEPVSESSNITRAFHRTLHPGEKTRVFPTTIVTSHLDPSLLPHHLTPEVTKLCQVKSNLGGLSESAFIEKNRHLWSRGKRHFKVNYDIKVLIGPADVRFELWFGGRRLTEDQPIRVEWEVAEKPEGVGKGEGEGVVRESVQYLGRYP